MKEEHTDRRTFCRACHGVKLREVIDLGAQPPSNSFLKNVFVPENKFPLRAVLCTNCYLMQLDYDVPSRDIFDDYVYFSSNSKEWLDHTRRYCDMIYERLRLNASSQVIEIGSNDGSLLENLKDRCKVLGIDPSHTVAEVAIARGVPTRVEHVTEMTVSGGFAADLIIANNVLAHIPALNGAVRAMARMLKPTGTITIEFPHVLKLFEGCEFDTIYHEHYSYLSLLALEPLLRNCGLYVNDVDVLPTHGGSLRLYITRNMGISAAVKALRLRERPLSQLGFYESFAGSAEMIRTRMKAFVKDRARIYAYGAAAKGNTFLNYCGLTANDICMVGDTTPAKQGKFLPGSHIPVVSEQVFLLQRPAYVLIMPWNWEHEIVEKLSPKLSVWGGKFIVAIPELRVFSPAAAVKLTREAILA